VGVRRLRRDRAGRAAEDAAAKPGKHLWAVVPESSNGSRAWTVFAPGAEKWTFSLNLFEIKGDFSCFILLNHPALHLEKSRRRRWWF
jgi:hypothetical protein